MDSTQSFRNEFLIALPALKGDYFRNTVSLLVDHTEQGAFGLVINRPLETGIADIFPEIGDRFTCPVLEGGPVQQDSLFFLHEAGPEFESTFKVSDKIYMTTSPDFIAAMRNGTAPGQTLAILGYAGWDSMQLEHEISQNVWLLAPADPEIVFETPFEQRPRAAARLLGIDLNLISPQAGHD